MINLSASRALKFGIALAIMLAIQIAWSQGSTPLLRLQRSKAYLDIDSHVQHAQGMNGITYGNPGDVWRYPNNLSCLVVYSDGKYVIEKRDEATLGKPKVKVAEGSLAADDMQQLKAILEEDGLKKIVSPPVKHLPDDAIALREIESVDAQIERGGTLQHFTTVKQRIKTKALSGMDTFQDNSTQYQKTLNPLMKWFDSLDKKSKSGLKDAKPQYCAPLNLG